MPAKNIDDMSQDEIDQHLQQIYQLLGPLVVSGIAAALCCARALPVDQLDCEKVIVLARRIWTQAQEASESRQP